MATVLAFETGCASQSPESDFEPSTPRRVQTGADVLEAAACSALSGRRVALIANRTSVTSSGTRTIDLLHADADVHLVRIFTPEHGLSGVIEGPYGDQIDEATGLAIHSLYGESRVPSAEQLAGLDDLVFDLQDVGTRFYTYISTLGLAMEACAENDVRLVVLDRPNPITGRRARGPIVDEDRLSFIAWRPLPIVHGMTVGEIAQTFNAEWEGIGAELEVVRMTGWSRDLWWDETGLPWINPSPNMRNQAQAILYPCIGLLEGSNISVGRGTDAPFERFGAPWMNGAELESALNAQSFPGVSFKQITFTPEASKFEGETCNGVSVTLTDRDAFAAVETGLAIIKALRMLSPTDFDFAAADTRLMSREVHRAIDDTDDWRTLAAVWTDDLARFELLRARHLIYD